MADYVSREVARERLRKTCKLGRIVSVLMLLAGLVMGGVAAYIGLDVKGPEFVQKAIDFVAPQAQDQLLAIVELGTTAVLFFLIGLIGILMFRKIAKTGDAFRLGQLRQLKFEAFLLMLLGFLPTVAANVTRAVLAFQAGSSPLAGIDLAVDKMCVVAGLFAFIAIRPLVAGSLLGTEEEDLEMIDPVTTKPAPDYKDVPDLAHVPTASPEPVDDTLAQDGSVRTFVKDPSWDSLEAEFDELSK